MSIAPSKGTIARGAFWSMLIGLSLIVTACGNNSSTAKVSPYTAPQLIQKASTNFNGDTALHFTLTATHIATGLFAVSQADGDVVRPDKLKLLGADMLSPGLTKNIGIIFVGGQKYADLSGTGSYILFPNLPDLLAIFSPDKGIGAILSQMQNPTTPTDDTVNGVECWKITGTVTSTLLAPITDSAPATPTNVQTTLWVGQTDYQIHQVTLTGKATDSDSDSTVRTFILSNYNETVTIAAPPTN